MKCILRIHVLCTEPETYFKHVILEEELLCELHEIYMVAMRQKSLRKLEIPPVGNFLTSRLNEFMRRLRVNRA